MAKGIDGDLWIYTNRQNTNTLSRIPILPTALSINKKYEDHPQCIIIDRLLQVISNQKMNACLKFIQFEEIECDYSLGHDYVPHGMKSFCVVDFQTIMQGQNHDQHAFGRGVIVPQFEKTRSFHMLFGWHLA